MTGGRPHRVESSQVLVEQHYGVGVHPDGAHPADRKAGPFPHIGGICFADFADELFDLGDVDPVRSAGDDQHGHVIPTAPKDDRLRNRPHLGSHRVRGLLRAPGRFGEHRHLALITKMGEPPANALHRVGPVDSVHGFQFGRGGRRHASEQHETPPEGGVWWASLVGQEGFEPP